MLHPVGLAGTPDRVGRVSGRLLAAFLCGPGSVAYVAYLKRRHVADYGAVAFFIVAFMIALGILAFTCIVAVIGKDVAPAVCS